MDDERSQAGAATPTSLAGRMDIRADIAALAAAAPDRIAAAATTAELDAIENDLIGKRSRIAELRRGLGAADPGERPGLGRLINTAAAEIREVIAARRSRLEREATGARLAADRVDVTLPGRRPAVGSHHLVNEIMDEIVDIFVSIGFTVATGPEAETEFYNFTALNIPATHPARAESDTLYLDYGDDPEGILLRTHTSPMQARYMEQHDPPVYIVVPGRVYRRDALDPTHTPVFHQIEGLAVDEHITFADLKGSLAYFARQFFGPSERVRFVPNHFPFTEPSAEMKASCFACDGSGCRVCSGTGWIEVLGCGMVHPAVFESVGYDPAAVTGYAFGMGVDRMAMIRHGTGDLRYFFEGDVRVLEQYR